MVQWHTAAATLYILIKDKAEVDIRVEREVVNVQVMFITSFLLFHVSWCLQYEDLQELGDTAIVSLHMLPTRPLAWAKGTDFDATCEDSNGVAIKILLASPADVVTYEQLVNWLTRNVNTGEAVPITAKGAQELWDELQRDQMVLSSDEEPYGDAGNPV
jgi:hypothetical protein